MSASHTTQPPAAASPITLRPGRPEDADVLGPICFEAFRTISAAHAFPPDFPSPEVATGLLSTMLDHPHIYSVVAEREGVPIASNFLDEHGPIAGVGPITVDPAGQNTGVGRLLMGDVLQRAHTQRAPGVRLLQAAFHTRSMALYASLGFEVREPISCLQGPAIGMELPGRQVRPATEADVDACNRVCHAVHGHERGGELRDAIEQGSATVVERDGRVGGYATVIGFFGHAVGESDDDVRALLGAAPEFAGPGVLVPSRNTELVRWCLRHGLRIVQPLTLMSLGLYNEPRGSFLPSIVF
jgi:GNAT superfamily N-acetyltransferase